MKTRVKKEQSDIHISGRTVTLANDEISSEAIVPIYFESTSLSAREVDFGEIVLPVLDCEATASKLALLEQFRREPCYSNLRDGRCAKKN